MAGGKKTEIPTIHPHHHPKFDVDEKPMLNNGKTFISALYNN